MDVSENSGTPKSSILIEFSIITHPFWGTTIFGNTYICLSLIAHFQVSVTTHLHIFEAGGSKLTQNDFPRNTRDICYINVNILNINLDLFSWWFFTDSTILNHHFSPQFGRICLGEPFPTIFATNPSKIWGTYRTTTNLPQVLVRYKYTIHQCLPEGTGCVMRMTSGFPPTGLYGMGLFTIFFGGNVDSADRRFARAVCLRGYISAKLPGYAPTNHSTSHPATQRFNGAGGGSARKWWSWRVTGGCPGQEVRIKG